MYSLLFTLAFLLMLPLFIVRREKYASGFRQRLGYYLPFQQDSRSVVWIHCVSVGETNAARPLAERIRSEFSGCRLIISTTTRTGQELAKRIFSDTADAVFYFPFDWKFAVRRALQNFRPQTILLMETEIWPNFVREAKASGATLAIVNGRLSERSAKRYALVRSFIRKILGNIDLALMQTEADAVRIADLGMLSSRIAVTGNMKFDLHFTDSDDENARAIGSRFGISSERPLILAASTHAPEERWVLDAYCSVAAAANSTKPRLMIAPRHPERFDEVAAMAGSFGRDPACEWKGFSVVRRSAPPSHADAVADVIILDSIGELRSIYRLAAIVFVGGSLIRHGGQSILEPAAAGKAMITGPFTHNFHEAVNIFLAADALIQLPERSSDAVPDELLFERFEELLNDGLLRERLGRNAAAVMEANRGAADKTLDALRPFLRRR